MVFVVVVVGGGGGGGGGGGCGDSREATADVLGDILQQFQAPFESWEGEELGYNVGRTLHDFPSMYVFRIDAKIINVDNK